MSNPSPESPSGNLAERLRRPVQVIVVSSVMFTFISCWRTAAVVLADLASTAYYIGGIVETSIGPAAPWFIMAVMLFSSLVSLVYIESCSLFVRGGVYRVVKEAMGGFLAKLSVSALMFDYILTGPVSAVSAGLYIMGLAVDSMGFLSPALRLDPMTADYFRRWGAVVIACLIILYFFRLNLMGIRESSDKALKIIIVTTVVAVILLAWSGVTLIVQGPVNSVPWKPDLHPKVEYETVTVKNDVTGMDMEKWKTDPQTHKLVEKMAPDAEGRLKTVPRLNEATGRQEDPLGFIGRWWPGFANRLRDPTSWFSIIGVIGLLLAFAHSILAMSGEETLAQVYREVESPKLPNFKKAALIVFIYSLLLTASVSFFAVLLIPDDVRMKQYAGNLIGGLAMNVIGPSAVRLFLNGLVVFVGFLILSSAVNTAIIGSNGVLNRVAEDGVMPDWFLRPHRRYGTTYRVLYLIVGMQLLVILVSRGNIYTLGEAYAFGIVWSFAFKAMAMVVLRFKDRNPREFKVPLNIRIRGVELPIGLTIIFLILISSAILNTLTKEVATIGGSIFTAVFLIIFIGSEHYHERKRGNAAHQHLEQFNRRAAEELDVGVLGLDKPYRKLVAIRSSHNLFMLEKSLFETDPETTDVIVMTAKPVAGSATVSQRDFDYYDRQLMTAVVNRAETIGKEVKPLIMPTNNPLFAIVNTAKILQVQELVLGASNKYTADEQLEQIAFYWMNVEAGQMAPLTVRILSRQRDVSLDLGGGNRIPKISERQARSVEELRSAGVGIRRALLVHPCTAEGSDLFKAVITMLDAEVALSVAPLMAMAKPEADGLSWVQQDIDRAVQLRRELDIQWLPEGEPAQAIVELALRQDFDVVIIGKPSESSTTEGPSLDVEYILDHAPCWVCLVTPTPIPQEVDESDTPPAKA